MKSRLLVNLVLALLLVALGAYVWLRPGPATPAYRLSDMSPAAVQRITIDKPDQPALVLQKSGSGWHVTEPYSAAVDSQAVERVLALLSAASAQRFPADDPARFALNKPLLRLTLNRQEFVFGTQHPVSGEQYVATGGAVYLVAPHYLADALRLAAGLATAPAIH